MHKHLKSFPINGNKRASIIKEYLKHTTEFKRIIVNNIVHGMINALFPWQPHGLEFYYDFYICKT